MRALLLTGELGSGKTSVAIEVAHQLDDLGIPNAAVDLDWLCWAGPHLTSDDLRDLLQRNLSAVAENLAQTGIEHLVLARALRTAADREAVSRALPGWQLVVVRLLVDPRQAITRIGGRDSGSELAQMQAQAAAIRADVALPGLADLEVDNSGGRTPAEVADQVLRRANWLDPTT